MKKNTILFDYSKCLLRLTDPERQKLQLVVAAFRVSEYTDDVDDFRIRRRDEKMIQSMYEVFDTITGLAIASDAVPRSTKEALVSGSTDVSAIVPLLEELFEIFRRHKRLNPYTNRGEYGKLVMFLQDIQMPSIRRHLKLESNLLLPLKTVGSELETIDSSVVLDDLDFKNKFLRPKGAEKQEGLNLLLERYGGTDASKRKVLERCLRSADDVRQFLLGNARPLEKLISYVKKDFEELSSSDPHNISIQSGKDGACFTQSHSTHAKYVIESLTLWMNVQGKIFDVWEAAETDMLVEGKGNYSIVNTGQGYHRMCSAPVSYRVMSSLVRETEAQLGGWVGIKVIHLGDRDVPNPLVFIDKYSVIPKIVTPIVHVLDELGHIFSEDEVGKPKYPGIAKFPSLQVPQLRRAPSYYFCQIFSSTDSMDPAMTAVHVLTAD
ncbi:hypothetical protein AGDE_11350 [Angomonas deanei]|nr:hypothetical protein AGDE_11350 [Angomonas deanei]|eukprot:EPY26412.1 hypothetical protein AGDE_11350 [Angomonas deanei]